MVILKLGKKSFGDPVEQFLQLQEQKGVTRDTISSHKYALREMFKDGFDLGGLDKKLVACLSKDISDSYFNKKLNAYRQFFDYLIEEGRLLNNPAKKWKFKRPTIKIVEHSDEDVKKFLSEFNKKTYAGLRDYTFAVLILDTGMRPTEVLRLEEENIDFNHLEINIPAGITKNGRFRRVPVSKVVLLQINKLLSYKPIEWMGSIIFRSSSGKKLPARAMQDRFNDISNAIGISITPYQLRHIFATTYIRNGGDVFSLKEILGHATTQMTMVYVNLNIKDLHEKHKQVGTINNFTEKRIRKIK